MSRPVITLHMNGPEDRERVSVEGPAFSFTGETVMALAPFDVRTGERGMSALTFWDGEWYRQPKPDERTLEVTTKTDRVMLSGERSTDVHVYLNRQRLGSGTNVRIELANPQRPKVIAAGQLVAVLLNNRWHAVEISELFGQSGELSFGPADLYEHPWEGLLSTPRRSRESALAERSL